MNDQHHPDAGPDSRRSLRAGETPTVLPEVIAAARRLAGVLPMDRPLVFLDLEATGLDVAGDRIVEINCVRVRPDGKADSFATLVNPEIDIPDDASAVHGIVAADVATAPTFEEIADEIADLLAGADLAGYNHGRYDLPLLEHEFERAGQEFRAHDHRLVDVSVIFRRMEPRSLAGALRFYCDRSLPGAHTAGADVAATMAVLAGQLDRYPQLPRDVAALDEFTRPRAPRGPEPDGPAEADSSAESGRAGSDG